MELKDIILSTLAELEEIVPPQEQTSPKQVVEEVQKAPLSSGVLKPPSLEEEKAIPKEPEIEKPLSDERVFCENLRERVLVLFEVFQSPNNKNIEAKIDLTLNFLEYLLAIIDERLEHLDSK